MGGTEAFDDGLASVVDERSRRGDVVVVRPAGGVMGRQALPYFIGISGASAGATGISMNLVVVPPRGAAEPHIHRGFETAVYLVKGRVSVRSGPELQHEVGLEEGDFLFIRADTPHQPVNLSPSDPAWAIVARNDPNEQESIEQFDHVPRV